MSYPPSIVCYGRDFTLVETRQQVFRRAGFASTVAHTQHELERCLDVHEVDVLVICHSVSPEDCEQVKQIARSQTRPPLVLLLNKGVSKCNAEGTDASFDARQGPGNLLQTLAALLESHGLGSEVSRRWSSFPVASYDDRRLPGLSAQKQL